MFVADQLAYRDQLSGASWHSTISFICKVLVLPDSSTQICPLSIVHCPLYPVSTVHCFNLVYQRETLCCLWQSEAVVKASNFSNLLWPTRWGAWRASNCWYASWFCGDSNWDS